IKLARIPVALFVQPGHLVLQRHGDDSSGAVDPGRVALADGDLVPKLEVEALVQRFGVGDEHLFAVEVFSSDPAREVAGRGVAADTVVGLDLLLDAVELVFLKVAGVAEAVEGDGYVAIALNLGLDGVGVVLTGLADKPGPLGAEELPPGPLG